VFFLIWATRFLDHREWQALHAGDWLEMERVATQANLVTPPGASIYSNHDAVYFAARRVPPPGMEHSFARERQVPPEAALLLHFTPQEEFNRRLAQGRYATAVLASGSDEARALPLTSIYLQQRTIGDYTIFWDRVPH
jgi:hypothetical protein